MAIQDTAEFTITGAVVRKHVAQSGKVAFLTVDVSRGGRNCKLDMRAFDPDAKDSIGALQPGEQVTVTGSIEVEPVKDKRGGEIKIDGYSKWVPALTARSVSVVGVPGARRASASAPPKDDVPPPSDDEIPF